VRHPEPPLNQVGNIEVGEVDVDAYGLRIDQTG